MRTQIASVSIRLSGALLSVGQTVVLARLIGAEDLGVYSAVIAVAVLIAMPVNSGLSPFLTREVAKATAQEGSGSPAQLISITNRIALLVSSLGMALMLVIATVGFEPYRWTFLPIVAALIIPLLSLDLLRAGAMRGLGSALTSQLPENVLRPGIFLAGLVVLSSLGFSIGVVEALVAFGMAAFVSALVGQVLLRRKLTQVRVSGSHWTCRDVVRRSRGLTVLGMTNTLMSNVDIMLFSIVGAFVALGQYRVALVGIVALLLVYNAVADVARRDFAVNFAAHRVDNVLRSSDKVTLTGTIWLGLVTGIYVVFGELGISFIFGEQFASAHVSLVILSIGHLFGVACGPSVEICMALGSQKFAVIYSFVSIIMLVSIGVLLLPWDPLIGISAASACSTVLRRFMLSRVVKATLGEEISLVGVIARWGR